MDKRTLLFMLCVTFAFYGIHWWFDPAPGNRPVEAKKAEAAPLAKLTVAAEKISQEKSNESFYVLENDYQQLVFSTKGGSLAEINLPLLNEKNGKSWVKEIEIDRRVLKDSPQNARFPLRSCAVAGEGIRTEGALGGYYPLLRRPVLGLDGSEKSQVPAEHYALNVVGEDPAIAHADYRVARFERNLIQFEGSAGKKRIVKTYSLPAEAGEPYCFDLEIRVEGKADGLWLGSGVPEVELVGGSYSPLLKYKVPAKQETEVETIDLPKKGAAQIAQVAPDWISDSNGFLGLIGHPLKEQEGEAQKGLRAMQIDGAKLPTRFTLIEGDYPAANYPGYETYLPLAEGVQKFRVFAGPYDKGLFKSLDRMYEGKAQSGSPDYEEAQNIQGWFSFISRPFTQFLSLLMDFFYAITHSWAASIILLTIALRVMMYPLNAWSIRSTLKMQEIAPKVKAIQDKYKKDPNKARMEVMNLYRESGANPLTGCLPMFLQMPFLIGMFYLLKSSFPLRGAVFIPGWIDDLAAPDVLFSWSQPIWFIGNELHLLPILMGLTMYLQSKMTAKTPKDASKLTDAQKQQKMMGVMMSVLFTVMFYNFPSGLNIYFMFSTLLGILQQWWMMKRMNAVPQKK